jgi:lysozyme family protein
MAEFAKYAPTLLRLEGGYVWHKEDQGGPTCQGVTLKVYQQYYGKDKTKDDLKNIPYGHWCHIMKDGYWDMVKGDEIYNQSLAEIIADWAVNSGKSGIRKVQELVGCKADGIVGPITLSLINTSDPEQLHEHIWKARQQFYINIVKRNPSQKVFMNGWMSRLNQFKYEE